MLNVILWAVFRFVLIVASLIFVVLPLIYYSIPLLRSYYFVVSMSGHQLFALLSTLSENYSPSTIAAINSAVHVAQHHGNRKWK